MYYIHCPHDNHYELDENLKNLFEELVIQPFQDELPTLAEDIRNIKPFYWEDIARILKQGQSNFDKTSFDESSNKWYFPKEKVLLYCAHYMSMHLYSSYHIFKNHLSSVSESVIFIDFGCGPLTSGIAFWAAGKQRNITYIGIDKSNTMREMAEEINRHGPYGSPESSVPFYGDAYLISDYKNELPRLLDDIKVGTHADTLIIFNFCYFLQSNTFNNPSYIEILGELLEELAWKYDNNKICLVYQDPKRDKFQKRWYNLKSWVNKPDSIFDLSGFTCNDRTEKTLLKYETVWKKDRQVTVSHDSINNFFYLENYSDR